jgi:hypothetical protein
MSTERSGAARRFKRWALLAFLTATACIGNLDDDSVGVTSPRYLDELCASQAYTLRGNALRTSGLTSDSCGFVLGPGAGSVEFDVAAEANFASYEVSALITRNGRTAWETLGATDTPTTGVYTVSTVSERLEVVDVRLRGVLASANCD